MPPNLAPTDPPWQHLSLSKTSLASLTSCWSLLHLLHHRSKNQHRRSHWYRHFSHFRKQLRRLLDELSPALHGDPDPAAGGQRARLRAYEEARRLLRKRLAFWADVCVDRWFDAFRQLVRDTQFGVLGLVMLACLGRVVRELGVLERRSVRLEGFGEEVDEAVRRVGTLGGGKGEIVGLLGGGESVVEEELEDFGRVVVRAEEGDHQVGASEAASEPVLDGAKLRKTDPRLRKKRRKVDEIDSIFGDL